ncbi:hypothetical protein FRACA_3160004 [Frankia canadensis]|uniref:Uncharacterized protein n=1 Tax=Frankia canadensis TaxID=1836972 RepID=A0A2I2KUE2_9ACTN|nr:hypothetical protein FRACA_3160004 [Frankia canadensis]SOU56575.1 hypothetical protein FRACA_3160004 [Frankia canadensis]
MLPSGPGGFTRVTPHEGSATQSSRPAGIMNAEGSCPLSPSARASLLDGHGPVDAGLSVGHLGGGVALGPPAVGGLDAGVDELQAVEEPGDLLPAAQLHRDAPVPVGLRRLPVRRRVEVGGRMGEGEVAAGGQGVEQGADDAERVLVVGEEVQDRDDRQGDRLGQVERVAQLGRGEDRLDVVQVRVEVGGAAAGAARQQGAGVSEDDRIVVGVDDAGFRGDGLGDLMQVLRGGDTGPDVEELADPRLLGQVAHRAVHERPVLPRGDPQVREAREGPLGGLAVGGEVLLATQQVVVHAGGVGPIDVQAHRLALRWRPAPSEIADRLPARLRHNHSSPRRPADSVDRSPLTRWVSPNRTVLTPTEADRTQKDAT